MQQFLHTPAPEHPRERNSFQRRLGLLVAIIIAALLVGSLVTVLGLSHQKPSTRTASPKSVKSVIGQIVYSGPQGNGWLSNLVWSADSQRLAATDGTQTKIWDATTGQHSIVVPLGGIQLAWSPTSNLLAIASSNSITLVDGETGQTIRTFSFSPSQAPGTAFVTPGTGMTSMVSHLPLSGPSGFVSFAWSPDGKQIASTYTYTTANGTDVAEGVVQVWDAQTGDLAYTLATVPGLKMGSGVSWSPDGQYIAANMGKWGGEYCQVSVWNVQSRQMVFQQSVNSNQNFSISGWQPGTDNFAAGQIVPGSNSSQSGSSGSGAPTPTPMPNSWVMKLWNVKTGQLLKSYPGITYFSWSPDGQQAVYNASNFTSMVILDINSGQKVYTYHVSDPGAQLSGTWSPNGKYIASIENMIELTNGQRAYLANQGAYIVKVWIA